MRYGAPSGQHDDCVMALAIAWTSVAGHANLTFIVKPFNIPALWPRAHGRVVGSGPTAAIWGARDPNSDTVFGETTRGLFSPGQAPFLDSTGTRSEWHGAIFASIQI